LNQLEGQNQGRQLAITGSSGNLCLRFG